MMKRFATSFLATLITTSAWAGWAVAADNQVNPFVQSSNGAEIMPVSVLQEDDAVPDPAIEPSGDYCGKDGGKGCENDCYSPLWSVEVDFLALRRDHMDDVPLVVAPNGAVLLNARDLNLDAEGGARLAVARQLNACNDIEFEFFVVDDWTATTSVNVPGAQVTQYGATFGTSPINLAYESSLYNTELNWRRSWFCDRMKTIVGMRWIELGESAAVNDAAAPPPLFVGDVNNHLYGFQIGLEAVALKWCRLEIEIGAKAGVYYNSADYDAAYPQAGPAASFRAKDNNTAFAGELMLGGSYCLTERLSIRAGYQVMWIEGVAILPEQLDDLAVPILGTVDMGGSPIYHGAYVGVELAF